MRNITSNYYQRISFIFIIVIVGFIGSHLLRSSHAATPYVSIDASSGTISTPANIQNDTTASGGKKVQFGGTLVNPPLNSEYGYFGDIQYDTASQMVLTLNNWKQAGAKFVRFQLKWSSVQAAGPSSYDWSTYDNLLNDILADNMIPLPVVGDTPSWAYPTTCNTSEVCAPATQYESAFGTFLNTAASRYSGKINDWEIWNEANNPNFWQPAPNPVEYSALLEQAYKNIHAAEPNAMVISTGLAPGTDTEGGGWISPLTFLKDIYSNGGHNTFDAVGWHPYTWPADPSIQDSQSAWYQMVNNSRALMISNNDANKKIWATEFGAPTCSGNSRCVSESVQASSIQSGISLWKSYDWAGPLIIYAYQDTCSDNTNPECFFGVTRADGSAKPALAVIEKNY